MSLTSELPAVTGATARQLDYWARRGYLRPDQPAPGSGYERTWPDEEIRVATVMVRLAAAGITPAAGERVARGESQIGPGVWVLVDTTGGAS